MTQHIDLDALQAAAEAATPGEGQHIYTNPRDDNNWKANEDWHRACEPAVILALIDRLRKAEAALQKIARWHGEFPDTGRLWDDGTPMSYGACFGSNGERDFMRQVALDALAAAPDRTPTDSSDSEGGEG